jgi:hypothetical protein
MRETCGTSRIRDWGEVIHSDPAAEVSNERTSHASEGGPTASTYREQYNVGLTGGMAPANQLRLSLTGSEDGEAETETC